MFYLDKLYDRYGVVLTDSYVLCTGARSLISCPNEVDLYEGCCEVYNDVSKTYGKYQLDEFYEFFCLNKNNFDGLISGDHPSDSDMLVCVDSGLRDIMSKIIWGKREFEYKSWFYLSFFTDDWELFFDSDNTLHIFSLVYNDDVYLQIDCEVSSFRRMLLKYALLHEGFGELLAFRR